MKREPVVANGGRRVASSANLCKLSGLALLAGVPLAVIGLAIHPRGHPVELLSSTVMVASHGLLMCVWLLDLIGLPGLYARLASRADTLGLVGFVLTCCGILYQATYMIFFTLTVPVLSTDSTTQHLVARGGALEGGPFPGTAGLLAFAVVVLGAVLFGTAIVRYGPWPRWPGWILPAGLFLVMLSSRFATVRVPIPLTDVLLPLGTLYVPGAIAIQLGLGWLGYKLIVEQGRLRS